MKGPTPSHIKAIAPILLTERDAREYLSGADPSKLCAPLYLGRRKWFAREALDRAVREKAGLPAESEKPQGSAYDAWKKDCA